MATKKCPNGHQYDSSIYGDNCPFCPESSHTRVNADSMDSMHTKATMAADDWGGGGATSATDVFNGDIGGGHTVIRGVPGAGSNPDGGRKIVGLLVSYTHNPAGEVFKIYEGRNIIGRSTNSDISFNSDDKMSGTHLLILYVEAEGIVWAEDQKSSNGTYINGKFARGMIELHTNDVIVIGGTKMVFLGIPEF